MRVLNIFLCFLVFFCVVGLFSLLSNVGVAGHDNSFELASQTITDTNMGTFRQKRICIPDGVDELLVADFNSDGFSDVALIDNSVDKIRLFLGDKNLEFKTRFEKVYEKVGYLFAGAADYTGDGKLDLAVENSSLYELFAIFPGKGNGELGKPKFIRTESWISNVDFTTTFDLNGDGKPDILALDYGKSYLAAFRNVRKAKFKTHEIEYKGWTAGLVGGDFTGDGMDDFFLSNTSDDKVYLFQSNGDGTFTQPKSYKIKNIGRKLYTADINDDGRLDLIGASWKEGYAWTMIGKRDGKFIKLKTLPGNGTLQYGAGVADLNGDGKLDIAAAEDHGIYIYFGKKRGKFNKPIILADSLEFGSIEYKTSASIIGIGDFNKDGKSDIVSAWNYWPIEDLVFFINGEQPATLTLSNLQITHVSYDGYYSYLRGSVDFSGSGIDVCYKDWGPDSTGSAFLEIEVIYSWPYGNRTQRIWVTGSFLDFSGENSGTIFFNLRISPPAEIRYFPSVSVAFKSILLRDYNLVTSNKLY